jgi:hypothetical protein
MTALITYRKTDFLTGIPLIPSKKTIDLQKSVQAALAPLGFHPSTMTLVADYVEKRIVSPSTAEGFAQRLPIDDIFNDPTGYFGDMVRSNFENLRFLTNCPAPLLPKATALKITPQRKLMAVARLFFDQCDNNEIAKGAINSAEQTELLEFYNKIDGIDIVERCSDADNSRQCFDYAFQGEPWFNSKNVPMEILSRPPLETVKFLNRFYNQRTTPIRGAIVVYCSSTTVNHYGVVESTHPTVVRSKWGTRHLYRHLEELVDFIYGNQVLYFVKK